MSDQAEQPAEGEANSFVVFNHEYAKKLFLAKAQASGLPVAFIQKPLEKLWDSMSAEGFALGRATDSAAQQALSSRLNPPMNRNVTFKFKV